MLIYDTIVKVTGNPLDMSLIDRDLQQAELPKVAANLNLSVSGNCWRYKPLDSIT